MCGLLGLTGYYRKFKEHYRKIVAPLTKVLKKNSFEWNKAADKAFKRLKLAMIKAPIVSLPDFSKTFIIECDASGVGVGAMLFQDKPIVFLVKYFKEKIFSFQHMRKKSLHWS